MHEINPKFELFDIASVGAGNWIVGGCVRDRNCPDWGMPGGPREIQKYREQSQNVDENKAHHFFEGCELCAFRAQFNKNRA